MTIANRKSVLLTLAVLVAALGVRLAAAAWWQARLPVGTRFAFGDSESYWALAKTIVRHEPYQYGEGMHVFRVPGYPLALAALFRVVGHDPPVMWGRVLGAVLGTTAVGAVMGLTRLLYDARAGWWAGCIAALYPGAISLSVFVLSEALFCPLMVLQLLCWTVALRGRAAGGALLWGSLAGVVAGCATLTRPSWLLFSPGAVALTLLAGRDRRRHLLVGMAMLSLLALTMLPWWVRSHRITGRFVATTLQVGASLYDGLSPQATGASEMSFVPRFAELQRQADLSRGGPLESTFEYRLDRRMHEAAVDWARRHPLQAVRLAGVKFLRMWSPWPNAADMQSWLFRLALLLGYTPLVVLAGWGLIRSWRRGWPHVLCALPAVYFTGLHVVFVSSVRYREPAMLALIVLAGGAWIPLWDRMFPSKDVSRLEAHNHE